jgi:hypothetical protein
MPAFAPVDSPEVCLDCGDESDIGPDILVAAAEEVPDKLEVPAKLEAPDKLEVLEVLSVDEELVAVSVEVEDMGDWLRSGRLPQ